MKSIISFRDIRSQNDVVAWMAGLDERWPERETVIRHICEQIQNLVLPKLHVVELCPGTGRLAEVLLAAMPEAAYTGMDNSEQLLTFARRRLASYRNRAKLIQADLNKDSWPALFSGKVHAIISMQSLHDLGGEAEVNRIYGLVHKLLAEGGLFLNADLVTPAGQDNRNNPGRLSVPRHLELLQAQGYGQVTCNLKVGDFACVTAKKL